MSKIYISYRHDQINELLFKLCFYKSIKWLSDLYTVKSDGLDFFVIKIEIENKVKCLMGFQIICKRVPRD